MSVRGYINTPGDQDWYKITLVAGQTYTFALSGFGRGALSDAYVRLFNASGVEIAFNDDSGPLGNSLLTFTASASGTYYVSAGGWTTTTGQYLLTMQQGTTPFMPVVTLNDIADYLTHTYWEVNGTRDHHWGSGTVTFNVTALEPERAVLARLAFQVWSEVCNLTFVETTGSAQIVLNDNQSGAFASSNYGSNGIITSANINVATSWYGGIDAVDSYTFQTFIHEIGHVLGLGHGGPYNGSATYGIDNTYANDSWQLSLMSYMDQSDYGSASFRFTMTPMMADILAVQNLRCGEHADRQYDLWIRDECRLSLRLRVLLPGAGVGDL
jgi:serralysin